MLMTIVAALIVGFYAAPFYGVYLMTSRKQDENRILGAIIFVLGLVAWAIIKAR